MYDGVGKGTGSGSLESLAVRHHLMDFRSILGRRYRHSRSVTLAEKSDPLSRPLLFHYLEASKRRGE